MTAGQCLGRSGGTIEEPYALAKGWLVNGAYGARMRLAWQGWRRDGWQRTWDRSRDFLRRRLPWMPRHSLIQPTLSSVAALTRVPRAVAPLASIIVPVYNKIDYTLTCLASLAACADASAYEVIVVDDGSTDDTAERVAAIEGVRYVRNPKNEGFIGSCNRGAELARGEFLVFLNNDTAVQSGWLDALLETFQSHPRAGLVGAKLLYPDGTLQEAGGILYRDGRGGNYGRFDAPLDPRYTHVREVDYCSGAAIAIRKQLFDRLGCFDDRYRPAYYEDADLAMRVREAGYQVLYQPRSLVIHFEGITSGTSESGGVKAYQLRNRDVFLRRWRDTLDRGHPAWGTPLDLAVQRQPCTLLIFSDASAAVAAVEQVDRWLAEGRALALWIGQGVLPAAYQQQWEECGVEVWSGYWRMGLRGWLRRHRARLGEVIVMQPADMRRYSRLFDRANGGPTLRMGPFRD